jgi:hypothetical protein
MEIKRAIKYAQYHYAFELIQNLAFFVNRLGATAELMNAFDYYGGMGNMIKVIRTGLNIETVMKDVSETTKALIVSAVIVITNELRICYGHTHPTVSSSAPFTTTPSIDAPPIVEQPIVEQPIVEQPIVEQPVVETPLSQTPVIENPIVTEEHQSRRYNLRPRPSKRIRLDL